MLQLRIENLKRFGFRHERGGPHLARTMMMDELKLLFSFVDQLDAEKDLYLRSIVKDNCLNKRSDRTTNSNGTPPYETFMVWTRASHCFDVFAISGSETKKGSPFWPYLSLLQEIQILKSSIPFIQSYAIGQRVTREALEDYIDNLETGRFSPATLKSTAQNINSSWTQSGHLKGRLKKFDQRPRPHPALPLLHCCLDTFQASVANPSIRRNTQSYWIARWKNQLNYLSRRRERDGLS